MSLNAYRDEACTELLAGIHVYNRSLAADPGVYKDYVLTMFTGAQLSQVYKLSGGVYTRLTVSTDYTLTGNTVSLVAALGVSDLLYVVPIQHLNQSFGGSQGSVKTKVSSIWLKRSSGFTYGDLLAYYTDTSVESPKYEELANATASIVNGYTTIGGFSGLTTDELAGCAAVMNGQYIGNVLSNTSSDVTIENYEFTGTGDVKIIQTGAGQLSVNGVDFVPVVGIPDITSNAPTRLYVKGIVTVPAAAVNYPNQALRIENTEFLE